MNIDGVAIHFIHVRSKERKATPLILNHGWPGSVVEFQKVIDPLTNPTAYGGKAEDAFDVIIPCLPGFGFSGKPTEEGWDIDRIGKAWGVLMNRLGYQHYVAQGGDWGAGIVNSMALQAHQDFWESIVIYRQHYQLKQLRLWGAALHLKGFPQRKRRLSIT